MAKQSHISSNQSGLARKTKEHAVAMTLFIAAAILFLASCHDKPSMAHSTFKHLPQTGWLKTLPLTFTPEYDDSTTTHDIILAVRHGNHYPYRNLSLAVDIIAEDSTVTRKNLDMMLADEYGNWRGGGFGALYQDTASIVFDVLPSEARKVVVWQVTSPGDTLRGVVDIGIIIAPNPSKRLKTAD